MDKMIPGFLGTSKASERLGIDPSHITRLLRGGKLKGVKVGHDWLVQEESLRYYLSNCGQHRDRRRRGKVGHSKKIS